MSTLYEDSFILAMFKYCTYLNVVNFLNYLCSDNWKMVPSLPLQQSQKHLRLTSVFQDVHVKIPYLDILTFCNQKLRSLHICNIK